VLKHARAHLPYLVARFVVLPHELAADFIRKRGLLRFRELKFLNRACCSWLVPPYLTGNSIRKKENRKEDLEQPVDTYFMTQKIICVLHYKMQLFLLLGNAKIKLD
jgi:hypothetical protein